MSSTEPPPDWAALYEAHKDAMHRMAKTMLRGTGLIDQSEDVVQDAVHSLMKSPPQNVRRWQAVMVTAVKNKAIDLLRSAAVRHAGPEIDDDHYRPESYSDLSDDVSEELERQQSAADTRDLLKFLPARDRDVVWRRSALEEPREQVAAELGVTPGRVSQITKAALEQLRDRMEKEER